MPKTSPPIGCWIIAVFIAMFLLKITGAYNWSWWIVTMPLWGTLAILIVQAIIHVNRND